MKINTNMPALHAYGALARHDKEISLASKRLSSGLKITSASDDAAGRAITNKLRLQSNGIAKASQNSSNAISVIQTAEGALGEITSMIQRMNELCVYAANGTNTPEDTEKMQMEINQLKDEINSTALKTDFNKIKLLNGDAQRIIHSSTASVLRVSDEVLNAEYKFQLLSQSTAAKLTSAALPPGNSINGIKGEIFINDVLVSFDGTDTNASAYEKIRQAAEATNIYVERSTNPDKVFDFMQSNITGSKYKIEITSNNSELLQKLGVTGAVYDGGTDVKISLQTPANPMGGTDIPLTVNATYKAEGNRVTITDVFGREICADIDPNLAVSTPGAQPYTLMKLQTGPLFVQIGSNKNIEMEIKIPKVTATTLELDRLLVGAPYLAQDGIQRVAKALSIVSEIRAKMGAYQNRLEFTVSNLDNAGLNTTQALSRIEDTDMAEEMMNYSKANVIFQAGISVLAQANQRPQAILQLLG